MPSIQESVQRAKEGFKNGTLVRTHRTDFVLPDGAAAYTAIPRRSVVLFAKFRKLIFKARQLFK
jgi:hypothetical protein